MSCSIAVCSIAVGRMEDDHNVVLASASYDNTIRFWHVSTGLCIHTIQHPDSQVNAMEVTPDRLMLAVAGYQNIQMFDLASGLQPPKFKFEQISKNVTSIGFQEDYRWMFTGGEDCSARIWDLRSRNFQCSKIFQVSTAVNSVCMHPNQSELLVADASGTIHLWDLRNDHNEQLLPEPNVAVQHVDVDPEGTMLAAVNSKGMAYIWSLVCDSTGKVSTKLVPRIKVPCHKGYALKVRFSPDSSLMVTTSADHTARVWRTADFSQVTVLQGRPGDEMKWVWDAAFTNDSQHVFTCSSDGNLRMWKVQEGTTAQPVRVYVGHQKPISAMVFKDAPAV